MSEPKHIKTALHHWWPQGLFNFWANDDGVVNQIFSNGKVVAQTNPKNFGAIRDGHAIKLGRNKEPTVWDQSFEKFFDKVDGILPEAVKWAKEFKADACRSGLPLSQRMTALAAPDIDVDTLLECMISLVVRSPRYRNGIGLFIGAIQQREHTRDDQTLINLNLRDAFTRLTKDSRRGKMLLLKSANKEFIFGDGFYTNYTSTSQVPPNAKIILPLTPCTAAMYVRPTQYSTDPRLSILELDANEADFINYATQVYSCDNLFYRSQKPQITSDFTCNKFLKFDFHQHPWIDELAGYLSRRFT